MIYKQIYGVGINELMRQYRRSRSDSGGYPFDRASVLLEQDLRIQSKSYD
jgi:hypothetical protein